MDFAKIGIRPTNLKLISINKVFYTIIFNNYFLNTGRLRYQTLDGYWTDAGTLDSLAVANQLVQGNNPRF